MKLDFDIVSRGGALDFEIKNTKTINASGGVGEDVVREIIAEETANLQPKRDEELKTKSKEIVGAINELHNREDKQGLSEEQVKEVVRETAVTQESDPTVPDWAKQAKKPTYSYNEITDKPENLATEEYADNASKQAVSQGVTAHNVSQDTHKDIRNLISELSNRLNAIADSDDTTLDQLSEIVAYIKANKALIESVTTSKVNVSDIINDLETNVSNKPLSASQGVALKTLINALETSVNDLANKTFAKPTSEPTSMTSQVIVYSPILKTLSYTPIGSSTGGKSGDVVVYSDSEMDYSAMISNLGTIYVATPKGKKQAANKEYVDNLVGDIESVLNAILGV